VTIFFGVISQGYTQVFSNQDTIPEKPKVLGLDSIPQNIDSLKLKPADFSTKIDSMKGSAQPGDLGGNTGVDPQE